MLDFEMIYMMHKLNPVIVFFFCAPISPLKGPSHLTYAYSLKHLLLLYCFS